MIYDVAILGAGAAGLLCAGDCTVAGLETALIEHNSNAGKKILISGGGRANFTNKIVEPQHFYSESKNFSKSALKNYTPNDFIAELVEARKIPYFEKTLGQLFCQNSARDLVEALESRLVQDKSHFFYNNSVLTVSVEDDSSRNGTFRVKIRNKNSLEDSELYARRVVVATGGLSIPKIGATSIGYEIAKSFGHKVTPLTPALTYFSDQSSHSFSLASAAGSFEKTGVPSYFSSMYFMISLESLT
jgi:hypothetical protein